MGGEGSIYRRKDGRWVAAKSSGPRGQRRTQVRYCRSRAEAAQALVELRASGEAAPRSLTVGVYLDSWVRDARNIKPRTRDGYASAVRYHLKPELGGIRLADLGPLDVERLLARMDGTRSQSTVRHTHATLRRALGQAVRAGLLTRNVASRAFVDAPKVDRGEPDALSIADVDAILEALPGSGIEAHVIFALGTGLRQGEQLGLAWENVTPTAISVELELTRRDGRYERVEPKTQRSRRIVPLSAPVAEAVAIHREQLVERGFVAIASGPVFINQSGGPLSGTWLTHRWYRLLEDAGLTRRPWKVLRATFASRLHDAGVPDRIIADLMGHARTHTTQRHYISTAGADPQAAVALLFDSHRDSHGSAGIGGRNASVERGSGEPRRTRTFNQLIKRQLVSRSDKAS